MKILDNIKKVFSIFHDGIIVEWKGNHELLELKIHCQYLAERIDSNYRSFYIKLYDINKLNFKPWMNSNEEEGNIKEEIENIFETELDILSAEENIDCIEISVNQTSPDFDYCGGEILLNCINISIHDEKFNEISLDVLNKTCSDYWNEWREKQKSP